MKNNFFLFGRSARNRGVSLIELLLTLALMGMIVLAFTSIDLFSRSQVIISDRRAQLQNEVALILQDMYKTVMQAVGSTDNPAFCEVGSAYTYCWEGDCPVVSGSTAGFLVRTINEDNPTWVAYILNTTSGNFIRSEVTSTSASHLLLSNKVLKTVATVSNFDEPSTSNGFDFYFTNNGTVVGARVCVRSDPSKSISATNPQTCMQAQIQARSASQQ